jgi:predicted DsbA family dithiol-disulfide isomerase
MHELLLADRTRHAPADLERLAERLGLDLERFRWSLESETLAAGIADDVALGHRTGVTGTPSFVLNGRRFEGTVPYQTLDERVTAAIADGRALVDGGVPRAEVYETLIRDGLELAPPRRFDTTSHEPTL